jgi:translation initiation factor IF-2
MIKKMRKYYNVPKVCIAGHVDHGKTTLLNTIRKNEKVIYEAGNITQYIKSYYIKYKGKYITFIDTPGHLLFSNMRKTGISITDIILLVIAADDGFMPQTDEVLKFALKFKIGIVVAINKIDICSPEQQLLIKSQMQKRGITPEEFGGDILTIPISALKNKGIDNLMESIFLQYELLNIKVDYNNPFSKGLIIETKIEKGLGITTDIILQRGRLKIGDFIVCEKSFCKIRNIFIKDKNLSCFKNNLFPNIPAKITGWESIPNPGQFFTKVDSLLDAKKKSIKIRERKKRLIENEKRNKLIKNFQDLTKIIKQKKQKKLKVILKSDTEGTLNILKNSLGSISKKIQIISSGIGFISKSDVLIAHSMKSIIIGFNVLKERNIQNLIKHYKIKVISHNVIYNIYKLVQKEIDKMIKIKKSLRKEVGRAEVKKVFSSNQFNIAGSYVFKGSIIKNCLVKIFRNKKLITESTINSLKREKKSYNEIKSGFECGIKLRNYNKFKIKDILICFKDEKIEKN